MCILMKFNHFMKELSYRNVAIGVLHNFIK